MNQVSQIAGLSFLSEVEKLAQQLLSPEDIKDIRSYRDRRALATNMSTAGSVGLLGSIPLSMLGKTPRAHKAANILALGGAASALGGLGVNYSANKKKDRVAKRVAKRIYLQRNMK